MKKLVAPMIVIALVMYASTAEAVIGALSFARSNLYNAKMRSYNAQINYYQNASLYYTKKQAAYTNLKYANLKYAGLKYSGLKYGFGSTKYAKGYSAALYSSALPTYSKVIKAANTSTVSGLMSLFKSWGW